MIESWLMYFTEAVSAFGERRSLGGRESVVSESANTKALVGALVRVSMSNESLRTFRSLRRLRLLSCEGRVSIWPCRLLKINNIQNNKRRFFEKKYKQWGRYIFFFKMSAGLSKFVTFVFTFKISCENIRL